MIEQIEGTNGPAYQTTHRGTAYYVSTDCLGRICVFSQRLALGKSGFGSVRHFASLTEAGASITALSGLAVLATIEGEAN